MMERNQISKLPQEEQYGKKQSYFLSPTCCSEFHKKANLAGNQGPRKKLGANLPRHFRTFLNVANGGSTVYSARIPAGSESEIIGFSEIYNTYRNAKGFHRTTFIQALELLYKNPKLPRAVLPIAFDGAGSEFNLDLTNEGYDRVVVFLHGLPASWTGKEQIEGFFEVAASFDDFIDSLFIEEDIARMILEDAIKSNNKVELTVVKNILECGYPNWQKLYDSMTEGKNT
jgi:hypothetical protein